MDRIVFWAKSEKMWTLVMNTIINKSSPALNLELNKTVLIRFRLCYLLLCIGSCIYLIFQGNKYFKEGRYEVAIECYTKGFELDPTNPLLPANRAMALLKLER